MAKYNFNLRDAKAVGHTHIFLIIRWNKIRLVYPTNEHVKPEFWETDKSKSNFQRGKTTKKFPTYPEFNLRLDKLMAIAKDTFRKYQNDNEQKSPSKSQYKELLDIALSRRDEPAKDLFSFFQVFIDESKKSKVDKTIKWYENTLRKLKAFSKKENMLVDFETIDLEFYHEFVDYLTDDCNYSKNSIGKHIQNLKAVLNEGVERELNNNLKFRSKKFKKPTEETENIYLTENEVQLMYELDLANNERLERVRDLFVVGCWTGLRYSDFSKIRRENIGDGCLTITMQKTGSPIVIPLHPVVLEIMNKYRANINSLPPSISDDKMRKYLKEIGAMIPELTKMVLKKRTKGGETNNEMIEKYKLIGTHTARRSFATNQFNSGLSTLTIMNITGHKTEKAFLKYIKTSPREHAEIMRKHWELNKEYKLKAVK